MTSIIAINGYTGPTGQTGCTGTFSGVIYQDVIPYTPNSVNLGNSSNYFNGLYVTTVVVNVNDVVFANINSNMVINGTYESTSTSSGALRVTGGVGIGGNLNVGGNTVLNGMVNQYLDASYTNTQFGYNAYPSAELGGTKFNTAVGVSALQQCVSGNYNTGVGYNALVQCVSGAYNTGLGYNAGNNTVNQTFAAYTTLFNNAAINTVINIAVAQNQSKFICAVYGVASCYYATQSAGVWSALTATSFGLTGNQNWTGMALTADASRGFVALGSGGIYYFSWTAAAPTNSLTTVDATARSYQAIDVTATGGTIVASVQSANTGYIYYSTLTGGTYSAMAQTLDTNNYGYWGVAVSQDGSRLAYGDASTNSVWYATWNGTNYTAGTKIATLPSIAMALKFSLDSNILYILTNGNTGLYLSSYMLWNSGTQTYGPTIYPISGAYIPTQTGGTPRGIAVDASNSIYVAGYSNGGNVYRTLITKTTTTDSSFSTLAGPTTGFAGFNTSSFVKSTAVGYGAQITGPNQIVLGTASETITIPGNCLLLNNGFTPATLTLSDGNKGIMYSGANNNKYFVSSSNAYSTSGSPSDGPVVFGWTDVAIGTKYGGTNKVVIYANKDGNVGINTTSPSGQLHLHNGVGSSNSPFIFLSGGGNSGNAVGINFMPFYNRGLVPAQIAAIDDGASAAHITISTAPNSTAAAAERIRILNSGYVGIGTSTSIYGLTLYGDSGGNGALQIVAQSNTISSGKIQDGISCKAWNDGNSVFTSHNTGGTYRGGINGSGSSNVVFATSSDIRLKEDVAVIQSATDMIKSLRPVTFTWKECKKLDFGFIAQEVYDIFPNMRPCFSSYSICECNLTDMSKGIYCAKCTSGEFDIDAPVDRDGKPLYYSLDYGRFTPYLTKSLQETISELEDAKSTINKLSAFIESKFPGEFSP